MTDLHIKYRPTELDEVVGQGHCVPALKGLLDGSSHAFIFTGASGVGKTTLARIMARKLGAEAFDAIVEIDAATHGGVEAMREIVDMASHRPMLGSARAFIVDEAHAMSKAAWQSLLKAVEEPLDSTYWFFCTTETGKIPRTIVTRCASFELRLIRTDDIFDKLVAVDEAEGLKVSDAILDVVAQSAMGSMRAALVGLSAVKGITDPKAAAEALRFAVAGDDTIDFVRYLLSGNLQWEATINRLERLGDFQPDALRVTIANYMSAVVSKTKDPQHAVGMMNVIEAFSTPYDPATARAGFMLSLARLHFN